MYYNSTYTQVRQNFLYFYSFACNLPDDELLEAETCSRDIVNNKLLLTTDCAICWIKYCTSLCTSIMRATCPYRLIHFLPTSNNFSNLKLFFTYYNLLTQTQYNEIQTCNVSTRSYYSICEEQSAVSSHKAAVRVFVTLVLFEESTLTVCVDYGSKCFPNWV